MSNILFENISIEDINSARNVFEFNKNELAYFDQDSRNYIFSCPHCGLFIEVNENQINCTIFRHGYYFVKNEKGEIILTQQLNQHASKEVCDMLVKENKIIGCGKPFKMVKMENGNYIVKICEYI